VQLITEKKIQEKVVESIDKLDRRDTFDMAMFYLSDRKVVRALKRADKRGAVIRILLDPNKDAFGRKKNGVPNRSVARELLKNSKGNTKIRWCNTLGEQCHSKLLLIKTDEGYVTIQGSANLTRRNLGNYNLETNIILESEELIGGLEDAYTYFKFGKMNLTAHTLWNMVLTKMKVFSRSFCIILWKESAQVHSNDPSTDPDPDTKSRGLRILDFVNKIGITSTQESLK